MTPDFCMVKNPIKMASNGEVIYMKTFHIVDMNIFEVCVIAIRSHLEGRTCVRNTEILYSEHYLAYYAPKMASYGKIFYMNCLRLVETPILIRKLYQLEIVCKSYGHLSAAMSRGKSGAPHQTWCAMGSASNNLFCASDLSLKKASNRKTFNIKVVLLSKRSNFLLANLHPRSFVACWT